MRWLSLLLWLATCTAQAGSYNYRNDSYAWESAANTVSWDGSCTAATNDDDKATINFSGGFTFPFNGTNHSSMRVFLDGMVQFGADTGLQRIAGPAALPVGSAPASGACAAGPTSNTLMVYWRDFQLKPILIFFPSGGSVSWEQKGSAPNRHMVVSWNDVGVPTFSVLGIVLGVNKYNFQLILYENGEFKYQYKDSNPDGGDATIGVQLNSSDSTLYGYQQGFNAAGSAVRWFPGKVVPAPLASYSFDESSYNGTNGEIKDGSGNANNATRVGASSSDATGQSCRSLLVPGNTSKTSDGADSPLAPGSSGGIDFYFRSAVAWGSKDAMLVDGSSNTQRPFFLMLSSSGQIRFSITDSSTTTSTATSPAFSFAANTWVHIAVSWDLRSGSDLSVLRIWINGVQQAVSLPQTANATINNQVVALRIGDAQTNAAANGGTLNSANGRIDELHIYKTAIGSSEVSQDYAASHSCAGLHHLLISGTSKQGVTCAPASFTLKACADVACSSLVTTGVTGTLSGSNAATLWPGGVSFSIPAGQGSIGFNLQLPVAGSTTLGTTSASPLAANPTACDFDAACTFTTASSALLLSVPHHAAASAGVNLALSAIRSSADNTRCLPAFASVKRSVKLSCGHANPATGTLWPSIGGGTCNAAGSSVDTAFDAAGNAALPFSYADVGQLAVSASYSGGSGNGDTGLVMGGSTSVIAAPASFSVGAITSPLVAGTAFGATLKALNASGAVAPNFMRESTPATPALSFTRSKPTGIGASDGSFSASVASVNAGVMAVSNAVWSEVGQGQLTASISNYLGSGLGASGSGATGSFIPHHFDVATTPACGSFSYAGQPFTLTVTARNGLASPGTTLNYDGSGALAPAYAQAGSYSAAQVIGAGSFSPPTLPASAFDHGVATVNTLSYAFTTKLTAPGLLFVRVIDANGVSSAAGSEGSMLVRSGRLRLSGNSGAINLSLSLPVEAQYWSGAAWVRNSADSCTVLPASAALRYNPLTLKGVPSMAMNNTASGFTMLSGQASLMLSPASPAAAGTLDVALNLGSGAAAQLCGVAPIPSSTGAKLPWLRSQNGGLGACGLAWDRDPSARASFGLVGGESSKVIDARIPN